MAQLYNENNKPEIRSRFIAKCDALIQEGKANSYADLCSNINISPASFNQVKSGPAMPTVEMLYNLQAAYKVSIESILFINPPQVNQVLIKNQLNAILNSVQSIQSELSV